MDLAEETPVKHLLAFLCALAIVSVGVAFMVMDRAGTRPVQADLDKPPEPERFEGSAETLSPAELHAARVRNTPTLADLRAAEEAEREFERRIDIARARPRSIRLPSDFNWGHCLLVVAGETRISGLCAYQMTDSGGFFINGPRQIYGGIDFPKAEYQAAERSNDYSAGVYRDNDEGWTSYGSSSRESIRSDDPNFGPVRRRGHCFLGKDVRICLWKTPPGSRRSKRSKPAGGESNPKTATPLPASDRVDGPVIVEAGKSATEDRP